MLEGLVFCMSRAGCIAWEVRLRPVHFMLTAVYGPKEEEEVWLWTSGLVHRHQCQQEPAVALSAHYGMLETPAGFWIGSQVLSLHLQTCLQGPSYLQRSAQLLCPRAGNWWGSWERTLGVQLLSNVGKIMNCSARTCVLRTKRSMEMGELH